jgi:hypothetical protein
MGEQDFAAYIGPRYKYLGNLILQVVSKICNIRQVFISMPGIIYRNFDTVVHTRNHGRTAMLKP